MFHGIARVTHDVDAVGEVFVRRRRISLTFRTVRPEVIAELRERRAVVGRCAVRARGLRGNRLCDVRNSHKHIDAHGNMHRRHAIWRR